MPAIYKILIVFVSMLVITRIKIPLGISLIFGGITLNLWTGTEIINVGTDFLRSLISAELWLMLVITAMVVEYGRFMTEKENAQDILNVIKRWGGKHGRTWSLMAFPAVVGLIPMPAGALFSAPLVQKTVGEEQWSNEWKSAVNYWFRHIWEYWWPLYPGVIVAISVFKMENWKFFLAQIPFTVVAIGAGYFSLVHSHVKRLSIKHYKEHSKYQRAILVMIPLLLVICSVLFMPFFFDNVLPEMEGNMKKMFSKMLSMLSGLFLGLLVIIKDEKKRNTGIRVFSSLKSPKSQSIMLSIAGVMIFKYLLDTSGLIETASMEMRNSNLSLLYIVAGLPFLAGLITGVAVGFTGASFPLIAGLMSVQGSGLTPMSTLVLAYGFGYMGMMISPVHLCLITTRDYFRASMIKIYAQIFPCVLSILAYSISAHIVFSLLGW